LACSFLFCVVPECLFLLPLFVWQAQFLLAGMGVNGPDVFFRFSARRARRQFSVSLVLGTSVRIPLQQFGGHEPE